MDTTVKSANETQLVFSIKESLNGIMYNILIFLMTSSFFWVGISLAILIHFIARYIFAPKNDDKTQRDFPERERDIDDLNPLMQLAGILETNHDYFENNEKYTPSFRFKFDYQLPEERSEVKTEPTGPVLKENELVYSKEEEQLLVADEVPLSTSIQQYQFSSDKNISGFLEEPEIATYFVRESYALSDDEPLHEKKIKPAINLEKELSKSVESITEINLGKELSESYALSHNEPLPEEKNKPEINLEKELSESDENVEIEPEPEPAMNLEKERERTLDVIPEKDSIEQTEEETVVSYQDSCSENEDGHMYHREENLEIVAEHVPKTLDGGTFQPVNDLEEAESAMSDTEPPLQKAKRVSSSSPSDFSSQRGKVRQRRTTFVSSEFSGFDSETESSLSDGYSVRDLVVDSDSDWFMSDRDLSVKVKLMDDKGHTRSFYGSDTESSDSRGQIGYMNSHFDEIEIWSENGSSKIENEKNELEEAQGLMEKFMQNRMSVDIELSDFSDSELEPVKMESSIETKENEEAAQGDLIGESNREFDQSVDSTEQEESSLQVRDLPMETEKMERENYEQYETEKVEEREKYEKYETEKVEEREKYERYENEKGKDLEEEENDELESLWEHQDLIEQLKMELKKVRAIGLPTILEESESPKASIEDLKPWRLDEKFLREDPMDELHKFYKSYRERMRKFDILNYQKMYAIGFLQLKDPLESMGSQKPLLPTISSLLSQNFSRYRRKSSEDPSERFIRELRCDLETVYVGQTCLSWEFLRWQYEKARELPEADPYRNHRYNQVAGEFQQFQVLVQRFVENEPYQGHRLPNYVKNRCVLRNLLQVPFIKEDCSKGKSDEQRKGNYAYTVTSDELEDIMEESIRIFWEFVKADKDETPVLLKGLVGPQAELQEPSDHEFMMQIHSIMHKKEKRLKDLLRTGNCLVKKFKKPKEDRSNQDLFFSQVDIKLVSRVLKMPRITSEQLVWCHKKLEKISFLDRRIQREPSFLLFPC